MERPSTDDLERWISASLLRSRLFGESPPRIDRFQIEQRVGEGSFGVVWKALDTQLGRAVALKILHRVADDVPRLREGEAMAQVPHPSVAAIHDVGTWRGRPYLVMEMVDGESLGVWATRTSADADAVLSRLRQVGLGLSAAHKAGLIHRDVKPDNIRVSADGRAKLLDFGVAALGPAASLCAEDTEAALTLPGRGTPRYMAPEQLRGSHVDARSDQYAFAVTAYETLCGRLPERDARTAAHVLSKDDRGSMPAAVWTALVRATSADPGKRFEDMDQLLTMLAPRRGWRRVSMALGVLGIAAVSYAGALHLPSRARHVCSAPEALERLRSRDLPPALAVESNPAGSTSPRSATAHARLAKAAARWDSALATSCPSVEADRCYQRAAIVLDEAFAALERSRPPHNPALWSLLDDLDPPASCARAAGDQPPLDEAARERERTHARLRIALRLRDPVSAQSLATQLLARTDLPDVTRMEALLAQGRARLMMGAFPEAESPLVEALELAKLRGRDRLAVQVMLGLSSVFVHQGRDAENRGLLAAAAVLSHRLDGAAGDDAVINVGVAEARALVADGGPQAALAKLDTIAPIVAEADAPGLTILFESTRAEVLFAMGRFAQSARAYADAAAQLEEVHGARSLPALLTRSNAVEAWFAAGQFSTAWTESTRVRAALRTSGRLASAPAWRASVLHAELQLVRGEADDAVKTSRELTAWINAAADRASPADRTLARLTLARSLISAARPAEAADTLMSAAEPSAPLSARDKALLALELARAVRRRSGGLDLRPLPDLGPTLASDCALRVRSALELRARHLLAGRTEDAENALRRALACSATTGAIRGLQTSPDRW